jgi:hypothetical protein
VEGNGRGPTEALSRHVPGETEKSHEKPQSVYAVRL